MDPLSLARNLLTRLLQPGPAAPMDARSISQAGTWGRSCKSQSAPRL